MIPEQQIKTPPAILFVDDEEKVLSSLNRLFFDEDYNIVLAKSGEEGLAVLREQTVQVIVADQRMPNMTGVEFLVKSKEISPDSIGIMLTGYTDLPAAQQAINEGMIYKFFTKPWLDGELKLTIKRAVEHYYLQRRNEKLLEITRRQNEELKEINIQLDQKVKERTKTVLEQNKGLIELNKKLSDTVAKVIRVFLNFIEMKSPDLGNHCKRVAAASRYLAAEMKLEEAEIETIEVAALLHDIGKIGLPTSLLSKREDQMTADELSIFQKHPLSGQHAIDKIENLETAAVYIRHHHENYNGTGYPDKLKGEEIPLGARIIAAADYYDELINRIYVNAKDPRAQARKAIQSKKGRELDGEVVDNLLIILEQRDTKVDTRKEIHLKPFELKDNMILSRDLFTTRGTMVFPRDRRLDEGDIKVILDSERLEKLFTEVYVYA